MPLKLHDTQFIAALQRGENTAFEAVYAHFIDPVRSFIYDMVRDQQASEDIAVEAFTNTFRKYADFATLEKLKAYLYITASNAAVDFLRKQKNAGPGL